MQYTFEPIGYISSCYKEKFGIPRQPGLVESADAFLILVPPYNQLEAFNGLEEYSHLWIQFIFHQCVNEKWKATVRPPKLGGNARRGVFATRSNYRPNPIGLSVVKFEKLTTVGGKLALHLKGGDFLDGTPVLDVKPYLPYSDSIANASLGFACANVEALPVVFSELAIEQTTNAGLIYPDIQKFIVQLVQNDPRPGYRSDDTRIYICHIYDYQLSWSNNGEAIIIHSLENN